MCLVETPVLGPRGFHVELIAVNEAEYHGLVEGCQVVRTLGIPELVMVGD